YLQQALAMRQKVYPPKDYPQGHPDLAASLNDLGSLLRAQGDYVRAREYYQQALAMGQKLYPKKDYPNGHPLLETTRPHLASLPSRQPERPVYLAAVEEINEQATEMVRAQLNHKNGIYKIGEIMTLEVSSTMDGYVYVFLYAQNGDRVCLFPNQFDSDN